MTLFTAGPLLLRISLLLHKNMINLKVEKKSGQNFIHMFVKFKSERV